MLEIKAEKVAQSKHTHSYILKIILNKKIKGGKYFEENTKKLLYRITDKNEI